MGCGWVLRLRCIKNVDIVERGDCLRFKAILGVHICITVVLRISVRTEDGRMNRLAALVEPDGDVTFLGILAGDLRPLNLEELIERTVAYMEYGPPFAVLPPNVSP